jgi:hypothetical protein
VLPLLAGEGHALRGQAVEWSGVGRAAGERRWRVSG